MPRGPGVASFTTRAPAARPIVVGGSQRATTSAPPAMVTIGDAQRVLRVDRSTGRSGKGSSSKSGGGR